MKKISEAVETLIEGHQGLRFGFHHRLLNLSQLARFLRPSIEAQTHKEVTESAVLMNLSRLSRRGSSAPGSPEEELVLDKVSVQSGLCSRSNERDGLSRGDEADRRIVGQAHRARRRR